jgi:hypothetical protein
MVSSMDSSSKLRDGTGSMHGHGRASRSEVARAWAGDGRSVALVATEACAGDGGGSVGSSSMLHGNRAPVRTESSLIDTNFSMEDPKRRIGHEKIGP